MQPHGGSSPLSTEGSLRGVGRVTDPTSLLKLNAEVEAGASLEEAAVGEDQPVRHPS